MAEVLIQLAVHDGLDTANSGALSLASIERKIVNEALNSVCLAADNLTPHIPPHVLSDPRALAEFDLAVIDWKTVPVAVSKSVAFALKCCAAKVHPVWLTDKKNNVNTYIESFTTVTVEGGSKATGGGKRARTAK